MCTTRKLCSIKALSSQSTTLNLSGIILLLTYIWHKPTFLESWSQELQAIITIKLFVNGIISGITAICRGSFVCSVHSSSSPLTPWRHREAKENETSASFHDLGDDSAKRKPSSTSSYQLWLILRDACRWRSVYKTEAWVRDSFHPLLLQRAREILGGDIPQIMPRSASRIKRHIHPTSMCRRREALSNMETNIQRIVSYEYTRSHLSFAIRFSASASPTNSQNPAVRSASNVI